MKKTNIFTSKFNSLKQFYVAIILCSIIGLATSCSRPAYIGSQYTFIDRPMSTDKKTLAIGVNAKINRGQTYSTLLVDNNSKELSLYIAKQFGYGYVQGGIFGMKGTLENTRGLQTSGNFTAMPELKGTYNGQGIRVGTGATFILSPKDEISFGGYSNIFRETRAVTGIVVKRFGLVKQDDNITETIINIGFNTDYHHKIKRGHVGIDVAIDLLSTNSGLFLHGTGFVTQGPVNIFVQSSYSAFLGKVLPTFTLGATLNLNEL
jgi:hypothetical protein